jgi:hypothetical protein
MLNKIRIFILFYHYYNSLEKYGMKPVLEKLKAEKPDENELKKIVDKELLIKFCDYIEKVRLRHPLKDKALCLHKSVLAYSLFIKKGVNVKLLIGIAQGEFEAHSWLEYDGTVLNDNHEYVKNKYKTIMEI